MPRTVQASNGFPFAETLESRQLFSGGPLDTTFNTSGMVTTPLQEDVAMLSLPNGRVVAAGYADTLGSPPSIAEFDAHGKSIVAPTLMDGSLANAAITHLALLPGGNILAIGLENYNFQSGGGGPVFTQVYTRNLTPVGAANISPSSLTLESFPSPLLGVQADGKMIVGVITSPGVFALQRLLTTAAVDPTFNHGQPLPVDFTPDSAVITTGKKIVVAGNGITVNSAKAVELIRLQSDGSLDTTFNKGGIVRAALDFGLAGIGLVSLAAEPNGAILAGGYLATTSANGFATFSRTGKIANTFTTPTGQFVVNGNQITIASGSIQNLTPPPPSDPLFRADVSIWHYHLNGVSFSPATGTGYYIDDYNTAGSLAMSAITGNRVLIAYGTEIARIFEGIALSPNR